MSALLPSATLFEQHQFRRLYADATETGPIFDEEH